jgi:hypothetical protein
LGIYNLSKKRAFLAATFKRPKFTIEFRALCFLSNLALGVPLRVGLFAAIFFAAGATQKSISAAIPNATKCYSSA